MAALRTSYMYPAVLLLSLLTMFPVAARPASPYQTKPKLYEVTPDLSLLMRGGRFQASGSLLVVQTEIGLEVYELAGKRRIRTYPGQHPGRWRLSADGTRLLLAEGGHLKLLEPREGTEIKQWAAPRFKTGGFVGNSPFWANQNEPGFWFFNDGKLEQFEAQKLFSDWLHGDVTAALPIGRLGDRLLIRVSNWQQSTLMSMDLTTRKVQHAASIIPSEGTEFLLSESGRYLYEAQSWGTGDRHFYIYQTGQSHDHKKLLGHSDELLSIDEFPGGVAYLYWDEWGDEGRLLEVFDVEKNIVRRFRLGPKAYEDLQIVDGGILVARQSPDDQSAERDGARDIYLLAQPQWMRDAMRSGERSQVERLLAATPQLLDSQDWDGDSPIHTAVQVDSLEILNLLLERGANLEARTREGYTPLLYAAEKGSLELVEALLKAGADLQAVESGGDTAVHLVTRFPKNLELLKLLINAGLEADRPNHGGASPLFDGDPQTTTFLLAHGADPNRKSKSRSTPLHAAAYRGDLGSIKLLLAAGADKKARDEQGDSPYDYARKYADHGNDQVLDLLQD